MALYSPQTGIDSSCVQCMCKYRCEDVKPVQYISYKYSAFVKWEVYTCLALVTLTVNWYVAIAMLMYGIHNSR